MRRVGQYIIDLLIVNAPMKIVALSLAIVITINARDQTFRDVTIDMPLVVRGLPTGWVLKEDFPATLRVRIRTTVDKLTEILPRPPEYPVDLSLKQNQELVSFSLERVQEILGEGVYIVELSPSSFTIQLEERQSKTVPVSVRIVAEPREFYFVAYNDIKAEPAKVTVQGPASVLANLSSIETVGLDLSEQSTDFAGRVRLVAAAGVKAVPSAVEVTVPVREKDESRVIKGARMVVKNCPPDLVCTVTPKLFQARVQGKKRVVDSFDRTNITYYVYVDASRLPIEQGKLQTEFPAVQPTVESPKDAEITLIEEKYFNVSVRREARAP